MNNNKVFYDTKQKITLIDGIERTAEEVFQELPNLRGSRRIVATLNSAGNAVAMDDIDILKQIYGVTEEDDEAALAAIIHAIENPPEAKPEDTPATQADMQSLAQQMTDIELMMLTGGAE